MAGAPIGSISDYLTQPAVADVGTSALTSSLVSSLLGPVAGIAGLGLDLAGLDPISAIMGAFSGRPTMQATQDIAGAANNSDPVIALLGQGAGQLNAQGVPISSSNNQASSFGPYFQVASDIENLVRWGTTNPTPQQAQLTATTLKNALTELGNPGQGTQTLQALQQAWQQGQGNISPQALQQLFGSMSPTEQNIFSSIFGNPNQTSQSSPPGGAAQGGPPPAPSLTPAQAQYQNQIQGYQSQYGNYVGQYARGGNPPPPTPPPPPSNPTPEQYQAYQKDYAEYNKDYAQYVKQNAASQPAQPSGPQYGNYGGPQPGIYPSGGQQFSPQYGLLPQTPTSYEAQPSVQQARNLMHISSQPGLGPTPTVPGSQQGRPPGCPPCPPSGGGGGGTGSTGTGSGSGSSGTGNTTSQTDLTNLITQLFSGNNPFQFQAQPGETTPPPNNPTENGFIQLLQNLIGAQTGIPGTTPSGTPGSQPGTQPGQLGTTPGTVPGAGVVPAGWWATGRMGGMPNFAML